MTVVERKVVDTLNTWERGAFSLLGLLLFAGAGGLLYYPPQSKQFPPQCASSDCATEMPLDATAVIIALMAVGGLMAVFALNGRRVLSVKIAGVEAQMAGAEAAKKALSGKNLDGEAMEIASGEQPAVPPEGTSPSSEPADTIAIDGERFELYELEDLPTRVLKDALKGIDEYGNGSLPVGNLGRVEFIARKSGKGNHPWLLKFRDQSQTWRVSYGGQGKDTATVSPVA